VATAGLRRSDTAVPPASGDGVGVDAGDAGGADGGKAARPSVWPVAGALGATALAVTGAALSPAAAGPWVRAGVVVAWAACGLAGHVRLPSERLGALMVRGALAGAVATLAAGIVEAGRPESLIEAAHLAAALGVALLPWSGLEMLVSLPDGRVVRRGARPLVLAGYAAGLGTGLSLWTQRPELPLWPVAVQAVLAGAVGLAVGNARYRRSAGVERQRMQWFGWAVALAAEIGLLAAAARLLTGWPDSGLAVIVAVATLPLPLSLVAGTSARLLGGVDLLLARTVSLAGLTAVVIGVYLVIVLGLGRVPDESERGLLALSMMAAALAAVLYLPARERLARAANRIVYGEREAPDQALRTFGTRLSRAVPLDELLLGVAESLRKSMNLATAEVWTGGEGRFERAVSVPDAPPASLSLSADEQTVVARAGVSGLAWARVWLPLLVEGRDNAVMRVAPVTHSGRVLGLIVAVRPSTGEAFREEDERILAELARQVGLALHNVALDSALQASLDEVRRQAQELQASRARIVAASDAARRKIERDLHDGAQQHLVALAVNLRLARQLADVDSESSRDLLDQLGRDLQDAVQQLRDLAHGIYPPLLMDRGLSEALQAAAGRTALAVDVQATGVRRHPSEVEAAVYFCCLEALQNAAKHAGAGARVTVRVWEEEGGLLFEVADDGAGFDPAARATPGAGFVNMADRVGAIGGSLSVESALGRGTKISGRIPVQAS
jgi:signal transduction histidine kinase